MSMEINGTVVFLREVGGMVDAMIRANTYADWAMGAYYYGLIDSEGVAAPGVDINEIGTVILEPGGYDDTGAELTPPVTDRRVHFNIRLSEPALSVIDEVTGLPRWKLMGINWTNYGVKDTKSNKNEVGMSLQSVVLIDANTIVSPKQVWL